MIRIFMLICCNSFTSSCSEPPALTPLAQDAVILAFGDSLTYGTGADREHSYPAVLQSMIGRPVVNAGVPGEVSARGLQRLPGLLQRHQPALLILCHGGNDILRHMDRSAMKRNLRAMIKAAQSSGADVIMLSVPEFGVFMSPAAVYAELANEMQIPLLNDVMSEILGTTTLKSDPIHPNTAGYRKMAEEISSKLKLYGALNID